MNTQENQSLKARAAQIYSTMGEDQRACIKFGMISVSKAAELEADYPTATAQEIALAFMDATKTDGGMVV